MTDISSAPRASSTKRLEPLRHVDAGVLTIAYYEAGPAEGPAVLLMHGFPYDIHSYVDVAPMLAAQGCRVIVPYLRGYGPTVFRDKATPRSGEQAAVGADLIALMDALGIEGFRIVMLFDNDPKKVGQKIGDFEIYDTKDMAEKIRQADVKIAMLTVPAAAAQETDDILVKAGVKAILNYAPISLSVPTDVKVQYIDPATHLQRMTYYF